MIIRNCFYLFAYAAAGSLLGCSDGSDTLPPAAPESALTVVASAVPEGLPGEVQELSFRVTMTHPQDEDVVVGYATSALSASAGVDYLETSGEVVLEAGQIQALITVEVFGDSEEEVTETLQLDYQVNSGNAYATGAAVVGALANDDSVCDTPYTKADPNRWRVAPGQDPLNYAHRGGVIDFPENTLYAYAEVAIAGADVLEMDVYQSADNELVILHDLDVDRTTDGTGNVVDLTLAELKTLDAAYWFVPGVGTPRDRPESDYVFRGIATGDKAPPPGYSAEDFQIPTLEEALQRFSQELINLELKPDLDGSGDYEVQMADLLQRYGRFEDLIAASFVDSAANAFKAAAPCVHTSVPLEQGTGLVFGSLGAGTIPDVPEHVSFQVPPDTSQIGQIDFDLRVVTQDFVDDSHAANLAVQVWTINTCEEMLEMMSLGVDAIMTDRPLLLESLLNTPSEQRGCD